MSGFIGGRVAERFAALGSQIAGVDFVADPERDVVAGDIGAAGPWQEHAAGADLVVHTAAVVSNAVSADETWRINVLGTRNVVDAAREGGARRLVHFSSIRAFSDRLYPPDADERWPVRPDGNPYVDTKIASEHVVLAAVGSGELPEATIIRPGDVYGPGSRPWVLLPLAEIKAGRMMLPARGRGIHAPVYIDDLLDGVVAAATSPGASGQILTLTGPREVTTEEYFGHLVRMTGGERVRTLPTPVAVAGAALYSAVARARGIATENNPVAVRYLARTGGYSIEKARALIGYAPRVDLDEGMRRTGTWLRAEGLL